jgi:hypothetical protein
MEVEEVEAPPSFPGKENIALYFSLNMLKSLFFSTFPSKVHPVDSIFPTELA